MAADVGILEILLRRRRLVPVVAVVALLAGLGMWHHSSGARSSGFAQAQVLFGAVNGQATPLDGVSPITLLLKAPLLADQLATPSRGAELAQMIGVPRDQLAVRVPAYDGIAPDPVPNAVEAQETASGSAVPNVLIVKFPNTQLPLITISAQAVDARHAAAIVTAGVTLLNEGVTQATPPHARADAKILVQQLGPVRAKDVAARTKPIVAVAAGLLTFVFGCCALIAVTGLMRARRRARQPLGPTAPQAA
jgi:hypothetical protein